MVINLEKFYKAFQELERLFKKHLIKYDHDLMMLTDGSTPINFSSGSQKIGDVDGGNYTEIEDDGTIVMQGDAAVWDDIRIVPTSFDRPGVSDPTVVAYNIGGGDIAVFLPEFAKDDVVGFTVQLPHDYKVGTNIKAHAHWTPGYRGNEENGALVGWLLKYSWANINSVFGELTEVDLQDACDGTDHKHQMTPSVEIVGTGKGISSQLICTFERIDTGTNDTWAGTTTGQLPMLIEIDFHYQKDTIGSREEAIK